MRAVTSVAVVREHPGRGAISAPHIADPRPRLDAGFSRNEFDQLHDGLLRALPAREPEPVVDMLPPDLPVKVIEFVVMKRDGGAVELGLGSDQGAGFLGKSAREFDADFHAAVLFLPLLLLIIDPPAGSDYEI